MTRVCLLGDSAVDLTYELLSRETARDALATYDIEEPFANSLAVDTVSLGAAVSLLNDLNWYLVRFVDEALVREPSVSEDEWLSRDLAAEIRNEAVSPAETGRLLKVYGVERPDSPDAEAGANEDRDGAEAAGLPRLVEPMLVTRTGDEIPTYDIRDVDDTLVVRVTEAEFEDR